MWFANLTRSDRELLDLIQRWKGSRVQAWEYSVSHGQLLVRFHREGSNPIPSLYLYCKNCHSVQFESHWVGADVRFSTSPGKYGPQITVVDGNHLHVVCGYVGGVESEEYISIPLPNAA